MKKYAVRLNDKFMTDYKEATGYNEFGDQKDAILFDKADKALDALADVVWGGDDEPPDIEEVK